MATESQVGSSENQERLRESIRDEASNLKERGREELRRAKEQASEKAREAYDVMSKRAREGRRQLEESIMDQPLRSVLIASGVGLLIGGLLARRS